MKLFKKLTAYKKEEAEGALCGFGILRAMDYDNGTYGHLILFSCVGCIKKVFIPF